MEDEGKYYSSTASHHMGPLEKCQHDIKGEINIVIPDLGPNLTLNPLLAATIRFFLNDPNPRYKIKLNSVRLSILYQNIFRKKHEM